MTTEFKPFKNDTQSFSVGKGDGLTINNGTDELQIYGEVSFKADDKGKAQASELLEILRGASAELADGAAEEGLKASARQGSLSIKGDLDLEKGKSSKKLLAKAIAALAGFVGEEPTVAK